jgi:CRISPR-associated endonuclease/helicase Cas3
MSLTPQRFGEFFHAVYGYSPFPWQERLATDLADGNWPDCIDLPTASGKTSVIDIAVYTLACQASGMPRDRMNDFRVGRRIFFTVNRRVIVDEAFERARRLAQKLLDANGGIVKDIADALRSINESGHQPNVPPLDVAQLRGGLYRDNRWARSLTQPMVVCTTADQLGSRILFRGYGVSDSMKPVHAALCACDSLVLLDEAHVTKAFCQTMQLLPRYQALHLAAPSMRFVQMTATPAGTIARRFELDQADIAHPVLQRRQQAAKLVTLIKLEKKKPIASECVKQAVAALTDTRKAVGVIVNRVQTARDIAAELKREIIARTKKDRAFDADVELVIGRMRPIDRDDLQARLRTLVGPGRPKVLPKPLFVVATQCLEVGADYDFDALITECASIDALRQRFGRLNRTGRPIDAFACIITNDDSINNSDPIYADAIAHTWKWLDSAKDTPGQVNFGVAAFKARWDPVAEAGDETATVAERAKMLSPSPDAAVLLPAHLDALCQTQPQPMPSPDVSLFIHGPQRDMAEVSVCWRADLGEDSTEWAEIVRLLPPTSPECMTVPLHAARRWMIGQVDKTAIDADVPIEQQESSVDGSPKADAHRHVLVWRGRNESFATSSPTDLRPGDTLVIPTSDLSSYLLGHIPTAPTDLELSPDGAETPEDSAKRKLERLAEIDVAERATRLSKRRVVIRACEAIPGREQLRQLKVDGLRREVKAIVSTDRSLTEDHRARILKTIEGRFDRHLYRTPNDDAPETRTDEAIEFRSLLDVPDSLEMTLPDDDDADDALSEQTAVRSLDDHSADVARQLQAALGQLPTGDLATGDLPTGGLARALHASAVLHDLGKADLRFQAMLAGVTPYDAMMRNTSLAKSDGIRRTQAERNTIFERAMYPRGFRHEMLSVQLIEHLNLAAEIEHRDLLLHLVAAHHGHARPFAPVCIDDATDAEQLTVNLKHGVVDGNTRQQFTPAHRLDSGIAERFWELTRKHGWWGLAWLEAILRLADQQASAKPGNASSNGENT